MNQPKPILTIKQKCRECDGIKIIIDKSVEKDMQMKAGVYVCKFCKSIQQTTEIYALRDFKKDCAHRRKKLIRKQDECHYCDGYKIPKEYEPYEIKTAQEFDNYVKHEFSLVQAEKWYEFAHNLKEDDKVVITNAK